MGKQVKNVLNIVAWATGVIVSLAVGFAMIGGSLTIPWLDAVGLGVVAIITGWIVVITTIISTAMAVLKQ